MIRDGFRPGDVGEIVRLHGELYTEYGLDERFEGYVAHGVAELATRATPGRVWLAEEDGRTVGCIGLTWPTAGRAQLRWFLVRPEARGNGLGRRLLDTVLDEARGGGAASVVLFTFSDLEVAAGLYRRAGFLRTEQRPGPAWGRQVTEERWELDLGR